MKIVCCQLDIVWENKTANFDRVRRLLQKKAVPSGAMIILPETFAVGFTMNVDAAREGKEAAGEHFLAELAREHGAWVLGGVVQGSKGGKGHNEAVVYDPNGTELARYRKMQPFSMGGETDHYEAGSRVITFQWGDLTVAPFVCYDLRFPELFRLAVQEGAQFMPVIANWPAKRIGHWATLLQARAIENLAYVAGINRCGSDPHHTYTGRSMIVDHHGAILSEAGDQECVLEADLDASALVAWREQFPPLRDMRPEVWAQKGAA